MREREGRFYDCERYRYTDNISFYYAPQDKDDKIYIHELFEKEINGKKVPYQSVFVFEQSKWNDYKLRVDYNRYKGLLEKASWFKEQVDKGLYVQRASEVN